MHENKIRKRIYHIIFDVNDYWSRFFDISILILILISILIIMLESVDSLGSRFREFFVIAEWVLTAIFTIEYGLRIYSSPKAIRYITSFYGVIDLLSIIPSYLSIIFVGPSYFLTIRAFRLLRIFRIFKLGRFLFESQTLAKALLASRVKISIFLGAVLIVVVILGSVMYIIEGQYNPQFSNIPKSMYWAIVTITTVGYGDLTPQTALGQFIASMLMIVGYSIIAIPTGIVSAEFVQESNKEIVKFGHCNHCEIDVPIEGAEFCHQCGTELEEN